MSEIRLSRPEAGRRGSGFGDGDLSGQDFGQDFGQDAGPAAAAGSRGPEGGLDGSDDGTGPLGGEYLFGQGEDALFGDSHPEGLFGGSGEGALLESGAFSASGRGSGAAKGGGTGNRPYGVGGSAIVVYGGSGGLDFLLAENADPDSLSDDGQAMGRVGVIVLDAGGLSLSMLDDMAGQLHIPVRDGEPDFSAWTEVPEAGTREIGGGTYVTMTRAAETPDPGQMRILVRQPLPVAPSEGMCRQSMPDFKADAVLGPRREGDPALASE